MHSLTSPSGAVISYEKYGRGPPLVLVHGSFSNHQTNWAFVKPLLAKQFTVYAVARRGRGGSDVTEWHSVSDEATDVAALIESVGERVFLLGHSYGAHVALAAALEISEQIGALVLYEPPRPNLPGKEELARLEALAKAGNWEVFTEAFFRDALQVPSDELQELKATDLWPPMVADAKASLCDMRALTRYTFRPDCFRKLQMPVMLQIGTESPRELFVTDDLAAVLPDVDIEQLHGQAHEGMTTAPELYAESVSRFLLS